ncbi:glycosyltransferase [Cohnella sp. CFH 77786]|uniref:glycosyltransferase n=1 Tax=Cohnella sp. CFH 77786 TaxID=2662265 RepID=UPI001C60E3F7|nr:glycosyltransferase [Cohnella sp. CFH 77786]MBW5448466.1 glycosyltransferase [Cohnella sp. CFH 77786]
MQPFLGLCMIVRNEGEILERCLSSVAPFVDEIVIVDTGSTDDTKAVASRFTPQVYDHMWSNDFAEARNAAIARSAAVWILMLDADEYLDVENLEELKRFLRAQDNSSPTGVIVPIYNFVGTEGSGKISESTAMRIFTRDPDLRFVRPIHEQLISTTGQLKQLDYSLPIYHTGYTTETINAKRKNERNQAILNQLRSRGDFSPYDSFLLGNEHFSQDRYAEAIRCYEEANQPSQRDKSWLPLCIANAVQCLIKLKRYAEAYETIAQAIVRWPQACDYYWLKGYLLAQLGYDEQAIRELQLCLRVAGQTVDRQSWLISPNHGSTLPLQQLAVLHLRRFDVTQAVACLTKLAFANPNHQAVLVHLLKLIRSEPIERISSLLRTIYPNPESHQTEMIATACFQAGLVELGRTFGGIDSVLAEGVPSDDDPRQTSEICMRMFRAGRYEEFDRMIQLNEHHSMTLAQLLGDAFFEEQQFELALDYYSLLLRTDELSGKGYENLARLYFAQNEIEEGREFLKRAIELLPDRIELYTLFFEHTEVPNPETARLVRELTGRFPGLRHFPLLPI